jgi:hypothetical protein
MDDIGELNVAFVGENGHYNVAEFSLRSSLYTWLATPA